MKLKHHIETFSEIRKAERRLDELGNDDHKLVHGVTVSPDPEEGWAIVIVWVEEARPA